VPIHRFRKLKLLSVAREEEWTYRGEGGSYLSLDNNYYDTKDKRVK
jgi:hypothetical protein